MNYSTKEPLIICADWLLDGFGNCIEDAAVVVDVASGKIIDVGTRKSLLANGAGSANSRTQPESIDAKPGETLLTPAFYNLHTHLDYSAATNLYGAVDSESSASDGEMFRWLRSLVGTSRQWTGEMIAESAASGARALALSGVCHAVDSSFSGQAARALVAAGLKGTVGLELFGLDESRADLIFDFWSSRYAALAADESLKAALEDGRLRLTVAPHAPYTVSPALWRKAKEWSATRNLPLLAHVAESFQESQWLHLGCKEVDDYLDWVMPQPPGGTTGELLASLSWKGAATPVQHLQKENLLDENLIAAHITRATAEDCRVLREHRARAVLCPRSNQRLGNGKPNIDAISDSGLAWGLGTDSLASSPDLDPLAEARAWRDSTGLQSAELLELITSRAAGLLNLGDESGSLSPGKSADICLFTLAPAAERGQGNIADRLFAPTTVLDSLLVDGRAVVRGGQYQLKQP